MFELKPFLFLFSRVNEHFQDCQEKKKGRERERGKKIFFSLLDNKTQKEKKKRETKQND